MVFLQDWVLDCTQKKLNIHRLQNKIDVDSERGLMHNNKENKKNFHITFVHFDEQVT